jgi:hypothetical protein
MYSTVLFSSCWPVALTDNSTFMVTRRPFSIFTFKTLHSAFRDNNASGL